MREVPPIELLNVAAEKLGDLCPEVVFLGGAVVGLLVTETGGLPPRPTKDVDVAIELGGAVVDRYTLEARILELGFRNDDRGPIGRYLHGLTMIDVITVDPRSPGGIDDWYPLAFRAAQLHTLANEIEIKVITPVCFLGTKMAAFRSSTREGHDDVFLSRDFGDIVRVVDGRSTIAPEIMDARDDLRDYLQREFAALLKKGYIEDAITEHVDAGRESIVLDRLRAIAL